MKKCCLLVILSILGLLEESGKAVESNWSEATQEIAGMLYSDFTNDIRMATYGESVLKKMSQCVAEDLADWGKKSNCSYYQLKGNEDRLRFGYLVECLSSNGYGEENRKQLALVCITKAKQRD